MTRKLFLASLLALVSFTVKAQDVEPMVEPLTEPVVEQVTPVALKFAMVNYGLLLSEMPEVKGIDAEMTKLKAEFDAEAKASQEEFNAKYETFLAEQRNYAPSILRKRQLELEAIMQNNENFRIEAERMLRNAREEMMQSAKKRLNEMIRAYAVENGYTFVFSSDNEEAVPFVSPSLAFDITEAIRLLLQ